MMYSSHPSQRQSTPVFEITYPAAERNSAHPHAKTRARITG